MRIGDDVIISEFSEIRYKDKVIIGKHNAIDFGFVCSTQLTIGNFCHISPHVSIIGGKTASFIMHDFCFLSSGARIVCATERFRGDGLIGPMIPKEYKDIVLNEEVMMNKHCGVLTNAVVLPGVTMAEGSILGANSLLKQDTEPWTIYAGNPAVPIKKRRYGTIKQYEGEIYERYY
jgi:acetyltransferase-like isoleucine patch superfamily enzyme